MKNNSKNKIKKRIVFVSGGSRGIGKAIVNKFLRAGCKVYFTYKNSKNLEIKKLNFLNNKNLVGIKCDMNNLNEITKIKKFLQKEDKIDVLINNVGDVIKRTSFVNSDDKLWLKVININLMSAVRTTKILLKLLKKSNNGVIVNVSSIASRTGGGGDSLHYSVAKSAINTFTHGLAKELKKIRVIGVAPSAVDTDFQKKYSTKKRLKKIIKDTPLGRIGTPEEISEFVFFASSSKASFLSGETIFFTGGR